VGSVVVSGAGQVRGTKSYSPTPCRTRNTAEVSPAFVTRCGGLGGTAKDWPGVSSTFSFGSCRKIWIDPVVVIMPRHLLRGADLQLGYAKTRARSVIGAAFDLVEPARILHSFHVVSSMAACILRPQLGPERSPTNHSGLAPDNLTTLAHFSVSAAMSLSKSAGEPGSTVPLGEVDAEHSCGNRLCPEFEIVP
jgi:hypothetical protein